MIHLTRTHLIERIRASDAPVTALVGPRGYGKTHLLEELTRGSQDIYISSADAGGEALNIAAHLIARLPDPTQTHYHYLRTHNPLTLVNAAAALRSDLAQHVPITIAIDDLHTLTPDSRTLLLDYLLPRLPAGVRILLGMRAEGNLRLSTLRLKVKIQTLTQTDLAFTPAEAAQLGLSMAQYQQTQGWPELSFFLRAGGDPTDYILTQTSTLAPELHTSLLRAALLPLWRHHDPVQAQLGLHPNWLETVRECVPCLEVAPGEYVPHTLYRQVLLDALQSQPKAYQTAQHTLGLALVEHAQPVAALEALLSAGALDEALAVVVRITDQFQRSHQLSALKPALERLRDRLTPDFRVVYGLALFEEGRTAQGLQLVEEARQAGATPLSATLTLARMRARSGNFVLARALYREALQHQPELSEALCIRAQLSFGEAVQARNGLLTTLSEIEPEAQQVLDAPQQATAMARAQAHTALALALAYRGQRTAARRHADAARDLTPTLTDPEELSALYAALATFYADEDQPEIADLLLQQGCAIVPSHLTERHLQLKMNCAWIMLRQHTPAALRQALFEARTLRATTRQLNNTPQRLEVLTLGAICLGLLRLQEPETVLRTEFESTLEELAIVAAPYPAYQDTVFVLRALGKHTPTSLEQLKLGAQVPPSVQILTALAIVTWGAEHLRPLAIAELQHLSDQWGRSTLQMYANWLGIHQLPTFKPVLDVVFLARRPQVSVDGHPLKLSTSALHLLTGLIYRRKISANDARDVFGEQAVSRLHVTVSRLKDALKAVTGFTDPLGTERGSYTLAAFTIRTDIDRLYLISPRELPIVYLAPLLQGIPETEVIHAWRQECRHIVQKRIRDVSQSHPELATRLKVTLSATDPFLKWLDQAPYSASSTHALPGPAHTSETDPPRRTAAHPDAP